MNGIMSDDNDDVSLLEYMYVIGFTENQYYPSTRGSPTPGEQRYSSQARGYAERCNKGAEKILSGASEVLERRRRKSVTKIHTDILDLVYELSERRKLTSPGPKFRHDLQPIDSRLSVFSPPLSENSRSSSSTSLPIIEVQQLPPLSQAKVSLPAINPEAQRDQYRSTLKRKKFPRLTFPSVTKVNSTPVKKSGTSIKSDKNIVKDAKKTSDHNNESSDAPENVTPDKTKQLDVRTKPKSILKRRTAGLRFIENINMYNDGRYSKRTPSCLKDKSNFNMSYCQCSYVERAEKERIDNVMRRYSSKTNAGPLDFTKLQRQIERSKTMVW